MVYLVIDKDCSNKIFTINDPEIELLSFQTEEEAKYYLKYGKKKSNDTMIVFTDGACTNNGYNAWVVIGSMLPDKSYYFSCVGICDREIIFFISKVLQSRLAIRDNGPISVIGVMFHPGRNVEPLIDENEAAGRKSRRLVDLPKRYA